MTPLTDAYDSLAGVTKDLSGEEFGAKERMLFMAGALSFAASLGNCETEEEAEEVMKAMEIELDAYNAFAMKEALSATEQ
jgi:hypothetical protein